MRLTLSLDRFEGDAKEIAVLLADDGTTIHFPKRLLPAGTAPSDILSLTLERDVEATARIARKTKQIQDELKKTDPGGDIKL